MCFLLVFEQSPTELPSTSQSGVYFDEIITSADGSARYVPRSVQIDLENGVCNAVWNLSLLEGYCLNISALVEK